MRCLGLSHHLAAVQASATARMQQTHLAAFAFPTRTWPARTSRNVRALVVSTSEGNTSAMDVDVNADMERQKAALRRMKCNFCRVCGSPMAMKVPAGERELRHVCTNTSCGHIEYHNPKMVVGCLVEHDGRVLLCRRAIEPCKGLWTLPAGYMELQETTADGAVRETWEEANARVEIVSPYAHLDIPMIGQAYILFRARLLPPYTFSSGSETMDVRLFSPSEIPFEQLAFSSMAVTLRHWVEDCKLGRTSVHHGVIQKKPGVKAWDLSAFEYVNSFELMTADAESS